MSTRSLRNRLADTTNIWPGFVDVLATLLIVIIFVLMVFTVSQIYLSDAISGRDKALQDLRSQIKELSKILVIETKDKEEALSTLSETEKQLEDTQSNLQSEQLLSEQLQTDVMEDQLSLAAMHFLRGHYQEATNIYKQILISNHTVVAINVYLALCYYKLEYYDVSLELLDVYLKQYPNSLFALNLKACNHFNLYNGRAAELVLKPYLSNTTTISSNIGSSIYGKNDLIENNMVVFRNGSQALKILLPLSDYLLSLIHI